MEIYDTHWVDHFEYVSEIHGSPHSRLILAKEKVNDSLVVIKGFPEAGPTVERRFEREITATVENRGKHVIPILAYAADYSWYMMPQAAGSLAEKFDRPVSDNSALEILHAIRDALAPLHSRGGAHRDLKPQNILWLREGVDSRWVVADFGIVRNARGETTAPLTVVGHLVGTEAWAAPEQYDNAHDADPRSDVYSAAKIIRWVLGLDSNLQGSSSALIGVLAKAMETDPHRRHAGLGELWDECSQIVNQDVSIDSAVEAENFQLLPSLYRRSGASAGALIAEISKISNEKISTWVARDVSVASRVISDLCRAVIDTMEGGQVFLSYVSEVDPFLERMIDWASFIITENVAIGLDSLRIVMNAICRLHQFAPAKHLLVWAEGQGRGVTNSMFETIIGEGLGEFYADMARRFDASVSWGAQGDDACTWREDGLASRLEALPRNR